MPLPKAIAITLRVARPGFLRNSHLAFASKVKKMQTQTRMLYEQGLREMQLLYDELIR